MIPESVTIIEDYAFANCSSLTSIMIPESVTIIGNCAFGGCSSLTSITFPRSVEQIRDEALSGCPKLKEIIISNDKLQLPAHILGDPKWDQAPKLTDICASLYPHLTDSCIKWIYLNNEAWSKLKLTDKYLLFCNKQSKTLLTGYTSCMTQDDIELFSKLFIENLQEKPSPKEISSSANFCILFSREIPENTIKEIYCILKSLKAGAKAVKAMEDDEVLTRIINESSSIESIPKAEYIISNLLEKQGILTRSLDAKLKDFYSLTPSELPQVKYTDGNVSSNLVMTWLLMAHEGFGDGRWSNQTDVVASYSQPGVCAEAKTVLSYIDKDSLQQALMILSDKYLGQSGRSKKMFLAYPICRYADINTMAELLKRAPKWRSSVSGNNAPSLYTFRMACLYSEHRDVMMFAEKYGDLDKYAEIRETDADTIRDTVLSDVGFDEDGTKKYDIGNTTVIASLQSDLTISLFDTNANKVVKSIPKKGNDESLVAAATADFSVLKKNVKKIVKNRSDKLFEAFLYEEETNGASWKSIYFTNPLLRHVAELVVWKQGNVTFIIKGKQTITSSGSLYDVNDEPVFVAHPMEMNADDLDKWRQYFVSNGLKQPFEQVWEPIVDLNTVSKDRYSDCPIQYYRFIGKEKHGIIVEDYDFHNEIDISLRDCNSEINRIDWSRHNIDMNDTFEISSISIIRKSRLAAHIIAYLDRVTVANRIAKDDTSIVEYLDEFTFAQICEFIDTATNNNCNNVLAVLMEYRNNHYPDYDPMSQFTLD